MTRMTTADRRIVRLASDLGLPHDKRNRAGVREYAFDRFEDLLAETALEPGSPDDLQRVVAAELDVQLERLDATADVRRLAEEYASGFPGLAERLRQEFVEGDTEGLTLQRPRPDPRLRRYLAIVDARGRKAYRSYFSEWHELTHLLVWPEQLELEGVRRTPPKQQRQKDPVETVVDSIAGELAFYDPFFVPRLENAIEETGTLDFDAVEIARQAFSEAASFYGAARAAVRAFDRPACFVRVEQRLKKAQRRRLSSSQGELELGVEDEPPDPPLRLVDFWANDATEGSPLQLHQHMRVPERSVLHEVHDSPHSQTRSRLEDQSWWETSGKGPYPPLPIRVEATRRGQWVYGLIQIDGAESG
jgi:hypothetical protein